MDSVKRTNLNENHPFKLSAYVSLLKNDQKVCMHHALRIQQVFGGSILYQIYHFFSQARSLSEFSQRFWMLPKPRSIFKELLSEGFLVEAGKENDEIGAYSLKKSHRDGSSLTLLRILLTDECNLACKYCKVKSNICHFQRGSVSREHLGKALSFFYANSNIDEPKLIHISGGEPTLHWDKIEFIINEHKKLQRKEGESWVVLGTNATLVSPQRAKYLAQRGVKVIVSLDGGQDAHDLLRVKANGDGSFKEVERGIRSLINAGCELGISMTIGKHNAYQLQKIVSQFIEEYNPISLGVNMMKPPTPDQLDYEYMLDPFDYVHAVYEVFQNVRRHNVYMELIDRHVYPFIHQVFRHYDCGSTAGTTINLDSKGRMGPCKSLLIMEREQTDVDREDLYSTHKNTVKRWRQRSPILNPFCQKCLAIGVCGGGCAYEAYSRTGNPQAIDEASCKLTLKLLNLMIWDLYKLTQSKYDFPDDGIFIPSKDDRKLLNGCITVQPFTLRYSIGHATSSILSTDRQEIRK